MAGATWPLRKLRLREALRDCMRRGSGDDVVGNAGSGSKAKVSRSALGKRGEPARWCPQDSVQLVQITLITMVYGRYIDILTMVYKQTCNWVGTTLWGMGKRRRFRRIMEKANLKLESDAWDNG